MPTNTLNTLGQVIDNEFGHLVGKTVAAVRPLTIGEAAMLYWPNPSEWSPSLVMVFTDGTAAIVSQDPEGNGPGWLLLGELG